MLSSTSNNNVRVGDDICEEREAGARLAVSIAWRSALGRLAGDEAYVKFASSPQDNIYNGKGKAVWLR